MVRGRGCNYCYLTGYRGRIGVYELLEMDSELSDALQREDLGDFLEACGRKESYVPMSRCALDQAIAGVTTLEEVIRITGGQDEDIDPAVSDRLAGAEAAP